MDPAIVIALITGTFGTVGAVLRIVEKYFPGKSARPELPPERPDHMDERIEWYVERLEQQNQRDREHFERLRADCAAKVAEKQHELEQLQKFFLEALERLESLSVGREKP